MLVTDKVNQLATDSNLVHSWAHGTETVTTEGGVVRTPAKLIADKDVEMTAAATAAINLAIAGDLAVVTSVADNISNVNAVVDNLAYVQASSANAAIAAESANYVSNYVDAIVLKDMAFPLDLGLIVDPVPFANTFDLGAL